MKTVRVHTSLDFQSLSQLLAWAFSIALLIGVLFLSIGSLLGRIGWTTHESIDLFVTGFICGLISVIVGNITSYKQQNDA